MPGLEKWNFEIIFKGNCGNMEIMELYKNVNLIRISIHIYI